MPFDGPGIDYQPDDERLLSFKSLAPPPEKKTNPIVKLLMLPLKILGLPFRLLGRLFRRSADSTPDADQ